jgi:hypothetical protein
VPARRSASLRQYEIASVASLLCNDVVTQPLGKGGRLNIPVSTKKKAGRGAQPKEDKMKKLVILNLRYQNAGEI